ncbi:hypothetical protein PIB30_096961 [Stylosanthes scabra]|uniref:Uncharacterized protein n=1 Tax=Stylosanthes scabra TaxID=79078 RepID=A0ABU6QYP3_9FABA|nr:hypothetical protein [Stylosanthes scabra]
MDMNQQQLEGAAREAAKEMYRLDGIAHVSHNVTTEVSIEYVVMNYFAIELILLGVSLACGLLPLARLNENFFKLDEPLVSAFVEHWRPKTLMRVHLGLF